MADRILDHEKLDVYRLAIESVGETFGIAERLSGLHRHSRDQWLRAAQWYATDIDYEQEHRFAEHEA